MEVSWLWLGGLAQLGDISLDFAKIPPRRDEIFHMNIRKWASPTKPFVRLGIETSALELELEMKLQLELILQTSLFLVP